VILLSLGGCFEIYDLFLTGYIAPGLARSKLLTATTDAFFGFSGIGAFVAATFAGLFVGTFFLGFLADRFGRRAIFTWALLAYSAASVIMAFQSSSEGVLLWRFLAGIGIGVEIITIDAYITELVPSWMRGRAFAVNQAVMFIAVPIVAFLAWWLVPLSPAGLDGWRWVVLIGAAASMVIWIVRLYLPESPLWLARHGRGAEAMAVVRALEAATGASGKPEAITESRASEAVPVISFGDLFKPPYFSLVAMFMVFNLCQAFGFYGFANWGRRCWSRRASRSPRASNMPSSSPSPIRSRRCSPQVSPTSLNANGSSAAPAWRSSCSASPSRSSRRRRS
jgi:putative MFS transporter